MNDIWNPATPPLNPRLQNFPEFQYPSIVGRPILRSEEQAGDITVKDIMCGDEAAAARSMLQISYPVQLLQAS
jgi:actin-related protein 2